MKNSQKVFLLIAIISCCFSSVYAQNKCSNAAFNKQATAESSTEIEIPGRAFDGDLETNWCAPGTTGWIQVDLQNKLTVDSLKLYVNQAVTGETVHEIKISEDMNNWSVVKTLMGSTSNNQILTVYFEPALSNVRGVMINTTRSTSWVAWYEIEVYSNPSKPTISQNGNVLMSSSVINNQWYFNGSPISGATSQNYTMTASGAYQVGVSNGNSCELLSEIVGFTVGVHEIGKNEIQIYPNPAKENVIVEGATRGVIELLDLNGQVIKQVIVSDEKTSIDISKLTEGVYLIKIITSEGTVVRKLLKQ